MLLFFAFILLLLWQRYAVRADQSKVRRKARLERQPRPVQPGLDIGQADVGDLGNLFVRQPFQIAQCNQQALFGRKRSKRFVYNALKLALLGDAPDIGLRVGGFRPGGAFAYCAVIVQ